MRIIFIAYKIQRGMGSEDGCGYNVALRLVRAGHDVTLISRANNIALLRNDPDFAEVRLIGIDVPKVLSFYKRGGRGIIIYYYLWQFLVGRLVSRLTAESRYDVVHQFNFHGDWAPHFLSNPAGRMIWGPIAHTERIPMDFVRSNRFRTTCFEVVKELSKRAFWYLDPFLRAAARRTDWILYGNTNVAPAFRPYLHKIVFRPQASSIQELKCPPQRCCKFDVLSVGRLVPVKCFDATIDAFSAFKARRPDSNATLTIVGSGELGARLHRRADDLGIANCATFISWINQADLAQHYKKAAAFLYPSFEAQGLVVAEAMGASLPVICLADTGPSFLCRSTGEIAPRGAYKDTVQELAERIERLYLEWVDDPVTGRYTERCARVRDEYDSRIDWDTLIIELETIYNR